VGPACSAKAEGGASNAPIQRGHAAFRLHFATADESRLWPPANQVTPQIAMKPAEYALRAIPPYAIRYSITASAKLNSVSGISMPSASRVQATWWQAR
jgi:hypothetical protein